ncbi:GNAT family N-acetyltransferase [Actinophytocola sp.]|uniref:GNAT family N-acetyltransferase n=1 Tax=Actinophytocola sp. TaxID=1872138 RepID=UPI003D6C2204
MDFRRGDEHDLPVLLDFFDEAVEWMVARGNTGQWGTEPWSAQPDRVERVRGMIDGGELWIAEVDQAPAGALVVSDRRPPYAPPLDEPELYVVLVLVSRRHAGARIGSALLGLARDLARRREVSLLRVDCYAGGTGELVGYYTRHGFTPTETFTVGTWPGQLFEQRL